MWLRFREALNVWSNYGRWANKARHSGHSLGWTQRSKGQTTATQEKTHRDQFYNRMVYSFSFSSLLRFLNRLKKEKRLPKITLVKRETAAFEAHRNRSKSYIANILKCFAPFLNRTGTTFRKNDLISYQLFSVCRIFALAWEPALNVKCLFACHLPRLAFNYIRSHMRRAVSMHAKCTGSSSSSSSSTSCSSSWMRDSLSRRLPKDALECRQRKRLARLVQRVRRSHTHLHPPSSLCPTWEFHGVNIFLFGSQDSDSWGMGLGNQGRDLPFAHRYMNMEWPAFGGLISTHIKCSRSIRKTVFWITWLTLSCFFAVCNSRSLETAPILDGCWSNWPNHIVLLLYKKVLYHTHRNNFLNIGEAPRRNSPKFILNTRQVTLKKIF